MSMNLGLCENQSDPRILYITGKTYRHREALSESGFEWNKMTKTFWTSTLSRESAQKIVNQINQEESLLRYKRSQQALQTKIQKCIYSRHKSELDAKRIQLETFNHDLKMDTFVTIAHDGFCIRCKKNWLFNLDTLVYKESGISACPICGKSWSD